jgi:hypothetical protein
LRLIGRFEKGGSGSSGIEVRLPAADAAAICDGVALAAFAFVEDRLGSAKVEIGWCEVVDAFMIADVIVVFDEGPYLPFEIAR